MRGAVEGADHRALDAHERVVAGRNRRRVRVTRGDDGRSGHSRVRRLRRPPHADAHAVLFDRDLADARLLHDPHHLADLLGARLVDTARPERFVTAGALADRAQQRLGLFAEEREQQQLLLTRRKPFGIRPQLLEVDRRLLLVPDADELDGSPKRRIDRSGRAAEAALDEVAQLVDHRRVAVRCEDVQQCLRRDDVPDRRRKRRRADFNAHLVDLLEHLVEAVARGLRAQLRVERRHQPDRELALGGAHRDARRHRRDGLIADVLVDEVGGSPELVHVDSGGEAEPCERLRSPLGGDTVHGQGDRIDRGRDHVRAGARGFDRSCERVPARTLRVEAHRQAGDLAQLGDELARAMRLQHGRGIVEQDPRGAELRQALRRVDERLVLAAAVEEPRLELGARVDDRLGRLAQVVDVVQRVVQAEDVDAALRGARNEAAREVAPHGARADKEAAAQRERERRRRAALEGADALPRALDAAPDRAVEDAAARDFQVGEASPVEELREAQQLRRRHQAGERLLAEHADRRIDETRHGWGPYRYARWM